MNKISNASAFVLKAAIIPLAVLSLQTQISHAADGVELTDGGLELTVTANRFETPVNNTISSTTVITAKEIENQQVSSVQELLQATAGIQIVNNGGSGKVSSLFMRGTESDHTLILIDGVRVNAVSDGGASLQLLPVEMIERIEIVRGARTSIYGSDAIGGVIQIFTRKAKAGDSLRAFAVGSIGSHSAKSLTAGFNGSYNALTYGLSVKSSKTDGYNSCTGDSVNFAGCFTEELDDDGYDNQSVSFNSSLKLNQYNTLSANFLRSDNDVEFDGAPPFSPNGSDITTQVYGLSLATKFSENANLLISLGKNENKNTNKQSGVFFNSYDSSRDSLSIVSNVKVSPNGSLTAGIDYTNDKADDITNYPTAPDRDNRGLFAEYSNRVDSLGFQVGVRHDDNELYGSKNTGNIGLSYDIGSNLKLIGSYSSAFKAPTFDELYFPFFGVPTLKPEEAKVAELGLRGQASWGNWSTTLFQNKIENLIVYKADFSEADNIDKAEINGFEGIIDSQLHGWDINTNLTLLNAEDKSGNANDGKKLARRPNKSLKINLNKNYGKIGFGSTITAESNRFDNASNSRKINGYATLDLLASYTLSKNLKLSAKVGNVFDKDYETTSFYPQDGRNAMLSLHYISK